MFDRIPLTAAKHFRALFVLLALIVPTTAAAAQPAASTPATQTQVQPAQAQAERKVTTVQTSTGQGFPWGLLGLLGLLGLARRRGGKVIYLPAEAAPPTTTETQVIQPETQPLEVDEDGLIEEEMLEGADFDLEDPEIAPQEPYADGDYRRSGYRAPERRRPR